MERTLAVLSLVLLVIHSPVSTDRVLVESCSKGDKPLWIDIAGCNQTLCTVYDKSFVRMTGEMLATADAKVLRIEVGAHIWGFRLSFQVPLHRYDACQLLPNGCPLKKGVTYPILAEGYANLPFTGTTRVIEVVLRNEKNEVLVCGKSTFRFEKQKKVSSSGNTFCTA